MRSRFLPAILFGMLLIAAAPAAAQDIDTRRHHDEPQSFHRGRSDSPIPPSETAFLRLYQHSRPCGNVASSENPSFRTSRNPHSLRKRTRLQPTAVSICATTPQDWTLRKSHSRICRRTHNCSRPLRMSRQRQHLNDDAITSARAALVLFRSDRPSRERLRRLNGRPRNAACRLRRISRWGARCCRKRSTEPAGEKRIALAARIRAGAFSSTDLQPRRRRDSVRSWLSAALLG